jgi:hypothetical protein
MAVITIGNTASDRANIEGLSYTKIDKNNPANETGTITSVDIYAQADIANCKIGVFTLISGSSFTCRSATADLGTVTAGIHNYTVSLSVVTGDYLGIYGSSFNGKVETDQSGAGLWYKSGDQTSCVNTAFSSLIPNRTMSIGGTGTTPITTLVKDPIQAGIIAFPR